MRAPWTASSVSILGMPRPDDPVVSHIPTTGKAARWFGIDGLFFQPRLIETGCRESVELPYDMSGLELGLTPQGRLRLEAAPDAFAIDERIAGRLIQAFDRGTGYGLLQLGAGEIGTILPPTLTWWRDFAARHVETVCLQAGSETADASVAVAVPPPAAEIAALVLTAPPMRGGEYIDADLLKALWRQIGEALATSFAAAQTDLQSYLKTLNPAWNLVGRVHFNLAENRGDDDYPFAFLATFTTNLTGGKVRHMPLCEALRAYGGAANRKKLLSLLMPVQRAGERCDWLKRMVDAGDIFHPLRWTPAEAARLLASLPDLERAGVMVRMPATWQAGRPARPTVTATVGTRSPARTGLDGLIDFRMDVTVDGEPLSAKEIAALLAGTETLVLLRGRWLEIDRTQMARTMARFEEIEALAKREGLTFAEAMRLLSGAAIAETDEKTAAPEWSRVTAGPWLAETLKGLRAPDGTAVDPGPALKGVLRPYQRAGVQWLHLLAGLKLGACLADDMGLGKTIQVLALLLVEKRKPSLLVAPASLMANWAAEIERFAPSLNAKIVHSSAMSADEIETLTPEKLSKLDLAMTSYGTLRRLPVFALTDWRFVVLDEAQAIKNPNAKQTRAAKKLKAEARIALTGTPVENSLGDLWSIFDFINPGLLGRFGQFSNYVKKLEARPHNPYGPLRDLVRPYILRRMKTDKTIIADLPDKTEMKVFCPLSRKQAALYAQTVSALAQSLGNEDGIERKGAILAALMRLKQICNHPSQWLNDGKWLEADSGKWTRLRAIAEEIAARQEKMLIFTQFREMTGPLATFLAQIFGRPGLVLHGATAVKDRKGLVARFQEDETVPFFVLSLKAGGSGLTLTAASHVVHFDRWWNPSVENQATDRAFRIGQKKNVLVHKFVCRGTIEEKIDALIESKRALSEGLLAGASEVNLTELADEELLRLVALDIKTATGD
jgi:superfamily II DNA or RNA helicase